MNSTQNTVQFKKITQNRKGVSRTEMYNVTGITVLDGRISQITVPLG
jgi:hypothetical protein